MRIKSFSHGITSIIILLLFLTACKTPETACKTTEKTGNDLRVYYNFYNQKITKEDKVKEIEGPVPRKAGKDIVIEIYNYNPLKDQLSIENTSSDYFLADTGTLSKFIILPKIQSLVEGEKKKDTTLKENKDKGLTESALTVTGENSVPELTKSKTDCDLIRAYMASLNLEKINLENDILSYKSFISQVDVIKSDYSAIKSWDSLTTQSVSARLSEGFVTDINNFLRLKGKTSLNNRAELINMSEVSNLENDFYKTVIGHMDIIKSLNEKVGKLKGNCAGFLEYYKQFNSKSEEISGVIKEFDNTHVSKILPGFKENIALFDRLKMYTKNVPVFPKRITVENDIHTVTIFNKPVGSDTKVEHSKIKLEPVRGWKVDVAGGFFMSGLADNKYSKITKDSIYKKEYLVNGVVRDTTVEEKFTAIYKEKQSPISFGGMFFLHAHSQNPTNLNWGLYLGFGALFNDQTRWAGAAGGSLLIGKKQRFNINPGVLISQVDRLSSVYTTEKWYLGVLDEIPTSKSWHVSWVVGFSWNIK